jgi:hypothetical protein
MSFAARSLAETSAYGKLQAARLDVTRVVSETLSARRSSVPARIVGVGRIFLPSTSLLSTFLDVHGSGPEYSHFCEFLKAYF